MSESIQDQAARQLNAYFRADSPKPYQVETDGTFVYTRWTTDDVNAIFILRVTTDNNLVTNEYTIDTWANRGTATYFYNFS